jgi:hypothetical protein
MERFNDQDHFNAHYSFESMEQFNSQGHFNAQAQDNQVNAQAQTHQFDVQSQHVSRSNLYSCVACLILIPATSYSQDM